MLYGKVCSVDALRVRFCCRASELHPLLPVLLSTTPMHVTFCVYLELLQVFEALPSETGLHTVFSQIGLLALLMGHDIFVETF